MEIKTYKNLLFWKSARKVSLLVVSLIRKFPNEKVYWVISDQLLRAAFSVGANITEGYGKYQGKEYQRFIRIALGSANETEYWLDLLKDIYPNIIPDIELILGKNSETIRMLTATLNTLRKK